MGEAAASEANGLTFLQISDSHIGFHLPPNPNALGTLEEAIAKVQALPKKPAFMIHTGDISHLSLESQFDDADRIISQAQLDVHTFQANTIFSTRTGSFTSIATAAAPRAPAGTHSTPTACTSLVSSTSSISRAAAWAIWAPSSSNGSKTT